MSASETIQLLFRTKQLAGLLRLQSHLQPRNDDISFAKQTVKDLVPKYLSALVPSKRAAFTLAEVLITLGIIGVVATMTIPTLVAKYQQKVFVTRMKQTYSMVYQAYNLSIAENGFPNEWNYAKLDTTDPNYFDNFSEHMGVTVQKYFKPYLQTIKEGKTLGPGISSAGYYLVLKNGVTLTFWPDGLINSNDYFVQSTIYIIASIDGNLTGSSDKSRNYSRKDFMMALTKTENKLLTFGRNHNDSEIIDKSYKHSCNKDIKPNLRWACATLLIKNNWELPDSYPW